MTVVATLSEAKINISHAQFDALLISGDGDAGEYFSYTYDLRRPESPMHDKPILLLTSQYSDDLAYRAWRSGVNPRSPAIKRTGSPGNRRMKLKAAMATPKKVGINKAIRLKM